MYIISVWLLAVLVFIPICPVPGTEGPVTYRHPQLPFQFQAQPGWKEVPHPEDRLIYHMADPGGELNVMLWYTKTTQEAPHYLQKMADLKGYQVLTDARQEKHRGEKIWVLQAVGVSKTGDLRVILAAIPSSEGLSIVQIWCPLERYEEERDRMESILASVKLGS